MNVAIDELLPRAAASCHASSVLPLAGGDVLCAFFAGTNEGADDVRIFLCRRSGGAWGAPETVSETDGPNWNPVLFQNRAGEILLYYKTGKPIAKWRTMLRVSVDGGHTFSPARELAPGDALGRGPVRNHPLYLADGRVAAPASDENGPWTAFIDLSEDGGKTYQKANTIAVPGLNEDHRGVIQPTLWTDDKGAHALLRSTEGRIFRSDSETGDLWSEPYPTNLVNNNSGIDLCRAGGALYLVHNPTSRARTPLILSVSTDDGATFSPVLTLCEGEGEFSYPSILYDGAYLHITHTYRREDIRYLRVAL